ncbi:MAG: hypothetical protein P8173_16045 [Gammaproteobacteria bacterium]
MTGVEVGGKDIATDSLDVGFVARSQTSGERLGSGGCAGVQVRGWGRIGFGLADSREPGDFE